jgi:hypothetical protein
MQPYIIITCAFTRRWAIERWLDDLASAKHDPSKTSLAFIIDADEPYILTCIKRFAEKYKYKDLLFYYNENNFPNEVRLSIRRLRIAEVKNQTKHLIAKLQGDIIVGLEDDTVFPGLDIMRLIQPIIGTDQIGFVEGVQCGRHNLKMIGAWQVDNVRNPHLAETLPLATAGLQDICAGGFYGYATRRDLYVQHEYYSSTNQPYGPDVNYGLWVQQQGYGCLIDWGIVFGHQDYERILYPDPAKTEIVRAVKSTVTGLWERKDHGE